MTEQTEPGRRDRMPDLRAIMIAPAPVMRQGDRLFLDAKFIEGMRLHNDLWPGTFDCILREGATQIPFGARPYDPASAGFRLLTLAQDAPLTPELFDGYDLVVSSADDTHNFVLPDLLKGKNLVQSAALEYTLETRMRIAWLASDRGLARRLYFSAKLLMQERQRTKFLKRMDGLQANGYPAFKHCQTIDPNTLLFLDNRMTPDMFVQDEEMSSTAQRLKSGAPLRLAFSGRLDRMKGAQDLLPLARHLVDRGCPFHLDIYGTGELEQNIRSEIERSELTANVTLHEPVDFQSELVPAMRRDADLFVCCHRQSDPSCTYIESMGCGLAIAGYDNDMWSALHTASRAGWTTPMGSVSSLAASVIAAHRDREALIAARERARAFALTHDFHTGFANRMSHLENLARAKIG